jgi:hypothetical protein
MKATIAVLLALAAPAAADNAARYQTLQEALAAAAPGNSGLAGVAFGPLALTRYDTPGNWSFGAEASATFPLTATNGGLGNPMAPWMIGAPCAMPDGRSYGVMTDLGPYWSTTAPAPAFPACATNTHLAYNELLNAVRTCGNRCFVDVASLSNIDGIHDRLRGAIEGWLADKPPEARLILRITEGFPVWNNNGIKGQATYFSRAVRAGAGRVEVYGLAIGSGAPGLGTWSHAKLFDVYDLDASRQRALIGGQNHWTDYHALRPPFDSNTMITGAAAALPSLQLDAAAAIYDGGRRWLGRAVRFTDGKVRATTFSWATPGYANASFGRFSGQASTNPTVTGGLGGQTALVSLIDLGNFSTNAQGRTIALALHDLVMNEPKDSDIRVFGQSICRAAGFGVDGDCRGRNRQTMMGELVHRALAAALNGWRTNVWVLTSSDAISNDGYASARPEDVRRSLRATGVAIACADGGFAQGWEELAKFDNPRGQGGCVEAVERAIQARFHWRMTTAFLNGFGPRQGVGVHHKVVMFGSEAMFQGSFNFYQSGRGGDAYDSKLVENGAIILDPGYVSDHVVAFEEAWSEAIPILGGD